MTGAQQALNKCLLKASILNVRDGRGKEIMSKVRSWGTERWKSVGWLRAWVMGPGGPRVEFHLG